MKIRELYNLAKTKLKLNDISNFEFEAKQLLLFSLGKKNFFDVDLEIECEKENEKTFLSALKKRLEHYPLQYIIGEWEFYGLPFVLGEGVLIPRQDTELICDVILNEISPNQKLKILDLCSGSGCIAITLEKNLKADVVAVELSQQCIEYLEKNKKLNNSNVEIIKADVLNPSFLDELNQFDIIVSNPPYLTQTDMQNLQQEVRFEPDTALFGGIDGLTFYKQISKLYKQYLKPNGLLCFEIGKDQEKDIFEILSQNGYSEISFFKDLNNIIRVITARKL